MHRSKVYLYFGSLETHSQYRSATVQTYVCLGDIYFFVVDLAGVSGVRDRETAGPPACNSNGVSPCASLKSFHLHRTSFIQRAPSAARRCGSLELRRMDLIGSSAPLSAKLAKTKRLMSYGKTAHDNAK